MPLCYPTRPCGAGSCRTPGRIPCRRNASCWSCPSTSLALAFSGRCALWCRLSARAIATAIRSCRNMERRRRSLLRFAEPEDPWARSAQKPSAGFGIITVTQTRKRVFESNAWWCVWCVVRIIHDTASLSRRVRTMHLIGWQNTWEQAPGVPATPSPP